MKHIIVLLLLILNFPIYSQSDEEQIACNKLYDQIIPYSKLKIVSDDDLKFCSDIVYQIRDMRCQFHVVITDSVNYIDFSLTWLYYQICSKNQSDKGLNSFFNYLYKNKNSAEEELSFCFEKFFYREPIKVLKMISRVDSIDQKYFLDCISWGFINNRSFGKDDPHNDLPNKAMICTIDTISAILNLENHENMFYTTYPVLKDNHSFSSVNSYLVNSIKEYLIWAENYRKSLENR